VGKHIVSLSLVVSQDEVVGLPHISCYGLNDIGSVVMTDAIRLAQDRRGTDKFFLSIAVEKVLRVSVPPRRLLLLSSDLLCFYFMCCAKKVNNLINHPVVCLFGTRVGGTRVKMVT
jgi:hypothetical protein